MTVLCKIMMHFYLNATCIFGQPISIRCGRVKKKKREKKRCEEYGKAFAEEMD